MKVLKALLALCCLLLLVIAGALAYLQLADLNPHRQTIAAYLSDALGREVRLEGDIELVLWPAFFLSVEEVQLANASWGSEPEMARIGKAALQLRLGSLWQGPLEILDAQLNDTDLLLETGPDGHSNWVFADAGEATASSPPDPGEARLLLDHLAINQLVVRVPGPESERRFELENLTLAADREERLRLDGAGRLLELPLVISGDLGTLQQLAGVGSLESQLSLSLGESSVHLDGSRTAPTADGSGNILLELQVSGLQPLLDTLGVPLALGDQGQLRAELNEWQGLTGGQGNGRAQGQLGDIQFEMALSAEHESLGVQGTVSTLERLGAVFAAEGLPDLPVEFAATLSLGSADQRIDNLAIEVGRTQLQGSGTLAGKGGGSAFEVKARGALASELLGSLPEQPFSVRAKIDWVSEGLVVQLLEAGLGASDVKGRITLPGTQAGAIEIELESQRIDLVQLLPQAEASGSPQPVGDEPPPAAKAAPSGDYVFTEAPLALGALQDLRLGGTWQVAQLVTRLMVLEAVAMTVSLKEGALELDTAFRGADGGTGHNHLALETAGDTAVLRLENQLRDLRVNLVSGEVEGPEQIPPVSLTANLTVRGGSARAMAASSEGDVLLTIGPGRMNSNLMERFSSDILTQLVSALNPFAKTRTRMGFQCGVVAVAIEDGVAQLDPLMAQTDKLQVIAGGTADLNTERLNIEFNTKPRSGVGVSADMFVTPFVSLQGTLARPGVGIDEKSSLLTAGAAVATGGLSILWKGMLDRATGARDHCSDIAEQYQHPSVEQAAVN